MFCDQSQVKSVTNRGLRVDSWFFNLRQFHFRGCLFLATLLCAVILVILRDVDPMFCDQSPVKSVTHPGLCCSRGVLSQFDWQAALNMRTRPGTQSFWSPKTFEITGYCFLKTLLNYQQDCFGLDALNSACVARCRVQWVLCFFCCLQFWFSVAVPLSARVESNLCPLKFHFQAVFWLQPETYFAAELCLLWLWMRDLLLTWVLLFDLSHRVSRLVIIQKVSCPRHWRWKPSTFQAHHGPLKVEAQSFNDFALSV